MVDLQQPRSGAVALMVTVLAFLIGEVSQAVRVRRGAQHANLPAEVLFRLLFLAGILAIPLALSVAPAATIPGTAAAFGVGLTLAWLGLPLRWWSFAALGPYFTLVLTTTSDQKIVDRGPYRVVRHPSYTGLLMAVLGCAIMVGNWVGLVNCAALVVGAIIYRIRIEERALTENLGAPYQDFAAGRARLVPFIW